MGYRWYNAHRVDPAYPFGHGLSYTSFSLSNLVASSDNVTFTITNTGKRAGAAIPQMYLTFPTYAEEPPSQLKGFKKQELDPGQTVKVSFQIDARARSIWDVDSHSWTEVRGTFEVIVGQSSRDPHAINGSFTI